jgi:hypothetical protein
MTVGETFWKEEQKFVFGINQIRERTGDTEQAVRFVNLEFK